MWLLPVMDCIRKTKMKTRLSVCAVLCILCMNVLAYADAVGDDKWAFTIAPYAWLAGQKGEVATLPGLPATDIDVDFYDDILGNINGALFLTGEARKGRWGFVADIAYTDIEDENATPYQILWQKVTSQTKSWMVSAAGLYRLAETNRSSLDVIGGIRYWSVDSRLSLSGGPAPGQEKSNTEDWFDPLVGLKGMSFLGGSKFFISGGLAVGGFGVGSDFMADAWANLGYQWTRTFGTTVGYRYLDVDYEKDDFLYDIAQQGLVLGLVWQF